MTTWTMLSPAASGTYVMPVPTSKYGGPRDLTGMRFGRLEVIGFSRMHTAPCGTRASYWYAVCDCGSGVRDFSRVALKSGDATSCGCVKRETAHRENRDYRGPVAGLKYRGLHRRVVVERGKASEYACADCDRPAQEWSYEGEGTRRDGYTDADLDLFAPRCCKCHRKYDAERRRAA